MRVLHLLASPVFSGPAENVALLAIAQRALGHDAWVAVDRKREGHTSEEPIRPRLADLGLLDEGGLELSVKSSPLAMWRDVRRLAAREVDVVHAHFSHDHWVARLGRPRGAILARSLHAPRSLGRLIPAADAFTVPTPALLARLPRRRAMVLPALVDDAYVPCADRRGLRAQLALDGEPLVGMASTFQPSRNHALGLAAFARLVAHQPSARLVLVGDGEEELRLKAQAASLGISDRVTFAGYQSGPAFVRFLQALDSVWILGLGNDFSARLGAQARACGARVVAVDRGALWEHADSRVLSPTPEAIVEAERAPPREPPPRPTNQEIARRVLELYRRQQ